jgi:hypothetical protein
MGHAADRDFEFAWRSGRSFNRSITFSVIDVISCATAELRALSVQLRCPKPIVPPHSHPRPIKRRDKTLFALMAASSPPKQANGAEIQRVKPGGRIVRAAN